MQVLLNEQMFIHKCGDVLKRKNAVTKVYIQIFIWTFNNSEHSNSVQLTAEQNPSI